MARIAGQNSSMITEASKIPFGRAHKGWKLRDCPTNYLQWVASNLWDTDFHQYAAMARKILDKRGPEEQEVQRHQNLERAADEFLRDHGINPNKL